MAYSAKERQQILNDAIKTAKDEECTFLEEVISCLPIDKTTFYKWKHHESNELKDQIEKNKVSVKSHLRKEWKKSSNATLSIALYKLLANKEERKALSNNPEQEIDMSIINKMLEAAAKVSVSNV